MLLVALLAASSLLQVGCTVEAECDGDDAMCGCEVDEDCVLSRFTEPIDDPGQCYDVAACPSSYHPMRSDVAEANEAAWYDHGCDEDSANSTCDLAGCAADPSSPLCFEHWAACREGSCVHMKRRE